LACSLLFVFLYSAQVWNDWSGQEIARQGWVELFVADSVKPEAVLASVRADPSTGAVELIDKSRAKARFLERFGPDMLAALDSNPLPVSIRVQVLGGGSDKVTEFAARSSRIAGVEMVDSPKTNLDDLARFQTWVLRSGLFAGLLLFGVVFGVIRNSIQLSLRSRDRLIDNMRILGASRFQIEMPFAVEGALQGLLGGVLASIVPWTLLWAARNFLPLPVPLDLFWALRSGLGTLIFSGLAGLTGGWWTVRRTFR